MNIIQQPKIPLIEIIIEVNISILPTPVAVCTETAVAIVGTEEPDKIMSTIVIAKAIPAAPITRAMIATNFGRGLAMLNPYNYDPKPDNSI